MLTQERIEQEQITNVMSNSFIDYAMSVIISRAIADVRDGLKPVHRRILYAMSELKMVWNRPYKKSARIVGEVIGKYHPHGDSAVYDTMVRMTQKWKMRVPLVDGQGNFGSIDGDAVAAMRYTEARLTRVAGELLKGIKDENGNNTGVVEFVPNFDGEEMEPSVLFGRFPQLLVNGVDGIAVGMATSIPPHNLREVCEAIIAQMNNPEITVEELMAYVKGPDFPTGGIILGEEGFKNAYETGRGTVKLRGVVEREFVNGRDAIVIKQIPYQVVKENLIEDIKQIQRDYNSSQREFNKKKKTAQKLEQKGMNFLEDIRDETEGEDSQADVRIVIELKPGTNPDRVLKYLYKKTNLQQSYGIINLALVPKHYGEGQVRMEPRELSLKEIIAEYIKHQREVTERLFKYELSQKEKAMRMLDAVIKALDKMKEVIELISNSKSREESIQKLAEFLEIEEDQARHILQLRLQTLANFEQEEKRSEHRELALEIGKIQTILADPEKLDQEIKDDIIKMMDNYGTDRVTKISQADGEISDEELIEDEDVVITMSSNGLIKRIPQTKYRVQRRNGRGVNGMKTHQDDYVKHLQIANTHDVLMFFTNRGQVYKVKAHQIPMTSSESKGVSIRTVLDISDDEHVQAILAIQDFEAKQFVVFGTKLGMVKRTSLSEYFKSARNGIGAITLNEDDEVINVSLTSGDKLITLITKNGKSITIEETESKVVSRSGKGVRCISLSNNDEVVSLSVHKGTSELFIATNKGFAKRTPTEEFRVQNRGGKGVTAINTNEKNGYVIGTAIVEEDKQIILLTKQGIIIKMKVKDVSSFSRAAQGSKVINLKDGDELQAVDCNSEEQEEIDEILMEEIQENEE